ncbi:urease accessory protein [Kribbella rubisoli]|uniref:Urease accessory protein UreD n=1 Tax=Kribbella rubisoli TaxID=3075929 RepID=A0A4Q7VZV7_9ACTN|nr:urease accessory protein UreD [Kribbella rubisoli]RZU01879.1 urease accessory protein [Kribbella rubisoli]
MSTASAPDQDLPPEVAAYSAVVDGNLGVGSTGKLGVLELSLAPVSGVTRVVHQLQRAPLHLYRPIYLDPGLPGMAFLYLQQSGDGLVQGDRYRVDLTCADDSLVHVTTQTPTKVFAARQDFVSQLVTLTTGNNAYVEHLPDAVVPCAGSRFFQRMNVSWDRTSTVILGDMVLPGRVAYGESHVYDLYWSELAVHDRADGGLLFFDCQRMIPGGDATPGSPAVLGGFTVLANLFVITGKVAPETLISAVRALDEEPDMILGATELPNSCGVAVRLLGNSGERIQEMFRRTWDCVRRLLVGCPAPDLRKS